MSGGIDSTALAYWTVPDWLITIDYGQRCAPAELRASAAVAAALNMAHEVVTIDCSAIGSGDLSHRSALAMAPESEWWPYRNQLIVTIGASRALELDITTLHLGTVKSDGFHADGTQVFIDAMSTLLQLQEGSLTLHAPAIALTSEELVAISAIPPSILFWSHSCHTAVYACGDCRGCFKRTQLFAHLGF
jgi:7-cyano-7-deazaguanine synthase